MSYQFDHRQLAGEMEIFFFNGDIGAGLPVWLPNGVVIRDQLEMFIKELERLHGYERVVSPHLASEILFDRSGHLSCFRESMFPPLRWPEDGRNYYLKPMNCPHHHMVFKAAPRSYRQLPLRIAEYGQVYRYEPSGSLRGISRARGLCQNDGHIYLEKERALEEVLRVLELHELCYQKLNLKGYGYRLSKRDSQGSKDFQGPGPQWEEAEQILREALLRKGLKFIEAAGEAAFYGPKIDVQMKTGSGAEESIATVQLDFLSAERFDLSYVAESGERVRPWIIHRAPLGSHERFVALLLEYFDGQLPGWLAPVQLQILPVSENEFAFSRSLRDRLVQAGIRVRVDESQGSLSKRLLFAHQLRPFAKVVVGQKEVLGGNLKLQFRDREKGLQAEEMLVELKQACAVP